MNFYPQLIQDIVLDSKIGDQHSINHKYGTKKFAEASKVNYSVPLPKVTNLTNYVAISKMNRRTLRNLPRPYPGQDKDLDQSLGSFSLKSIRHVPPQYGQITAIPSPVNFDDSEWD